MQQNDIWARMAARYDTEVRGAVARRIVQAVRQELSDTAGKTAMDFGCGTGLIGLGLVDLFASMLFVDTSPEMIEQVQSKLEVGRIGNAAALCRDFLADPPRAPMADTIITAQVLLHIPDTRQVLGRLYDALHTDGQLFIVDFDKNEQVPSDQVHNGFDQSELIGLVKEIGFAAAHAHTFYRGEKLFMNTDASLFLLVAQK